MKLVYFSVTSNEIPNLSAAAGRFNRDVAPLQLIARTRTQLENNPARQARFVRRALEADAVVITLMAGTRSCPVWDALTDALADRRRQNRAAPYLHVQPTGAAPEALASVQAHADGVRRGHWRRLSRYHHFGGTDNLLQMLIGLFNVCRGADHRLLPPAPPPADGIHHPDLDHLPAMDDYLRRLDPAKPTIGIWFYQNFWITDNKAHIDALIRELERRGANVLCVFHTRFKDPRLGGGADRAVDRYFMHGGRRRIDVLLSPVMFSLSMAAPEYKTLLERLDVPVLQAISTGQSIEQWQAGDQGLTPVDITINVAQPELDGVLIGVPVAAKQTMAIDPVTGAAVNKYVPIAGRVAKMAQLALGWARLRRTPNERKKVAIVLHHYPPRNDRIGCAAGLDSFASVQALLDAMADRGYAVDERYADGDALARALLDGVTADRRWLPPEQMAARSAASVDAGTCKAWQADLPAPVRAEMARHWGAPPGALFVHRDRIYFPGIVNGNVLITIQPLRGDLEQVDKQYHDLRLPPPHAYLAHYRWIKEVFGADALVHVGKHGSLEWLPGKAVGLGDACYPDLALMGLPNIYPYIINDPGEGTQAKRRANACIVDHLPPPLTHAGLHDELADLENLIEDHRQARSQDPAKLPVLRAMIREAATAAGIDRDLPVPRTDMPDGFDRFLEQLHAYLDGIADTAIADGLHILGRVPDGDRLVQTLAQLTRLANGSMPSLRGAVAAAQGSGAAEPGHGRASGVAASNGAAAHATVLAMLTDLVGDPSGRMPPETIAARHLGRADAAVARILEAVRADLLPRLMQTGDELRACLDALDGRFVRPGPSGAPSRGQADILPTGRNFYSVDPTKIPTPAAWRVGCKLADALIARYRQAHDAFPESVGIILWASPTMRSKGDDVAEILYLMGLRPVWQAGSGTVRGLEVIPPAELGRPRIDVVPRISGIFRDAFPVLVDLIDQGVQMAAALEERGADNFIRRHVLRDTAGFTRQGMTAAEARRMATFRIFGAPPGSYGTGVTQLIESKAWRDPRDLGRMFIRHSSYAYGRNVFGRPAQDSFENVLGRMTVTVKNEDTREKDMMSCTDFYGYHGGLISAVQTVRGCRPFALAGDAADPEQVVARTAAEEARHIFHARLLNPKWLSGLRRHGYKGAGDISKAMDIILGWDATAGVVDDGMYRRFAQKTALDPAMQAWMKQVNPYALHNILDKLLEAAARGLWQADPDTLDALRDAFLEIEGDIEEVTDG